MTFCVQLEDDEGLRGRNIVVKARSGREANAKALQLGRSEGYIWTMLVWRVDLRKARRLARRGCPFVFALEDSVRK